VISRVFQVSLDIPIHRPASPKQKPDGAFCRLELGHTESCIHGHFITLGPRLLPELGRIAIVAARPDRSPPAGRRRAQGSAVGLLEFAEVRYALFVCEAKKKRAAIDRAGGGTQH
jgi:hypothetical protein